MIAIRKASINDIEKAAELFDAYCVFYLKDSDVKAAKDFLIQRIQNVYVFLFFIGREIKPIFGMIKWGFSGQANIF